MEHISDPAFKSLVQKGVTTSNVLLTKSVLSEDVEVIKEDEVISRKAVFTISTDSVDRSQDVISVKGWQTENYMKNPVVLWGHDKDSLPIGRVTQLMTTDNALKAEVEFATADINPLAESVYQGIMKGFIKGTSVGFQPLEFDVSEERIRQMGQLPPIDFKSTELLELSIVNVPCNAETLLDPGQIVDNKHISDQPKSIDPTIAKAKRARYLKLMEVL